MEQKKSLVVIAAHTGDFVWRCAGAVALHTALGYRAVIICLSYGERGEAAKLYSEPGMTQPKARIERRTFKAALARLEGGGDLILQQIDVAPEILALLGRHRA